MHLLRLANAQDEESRLILSLSAFMFLRTRERESEVSRHRSYGALVWQEEELLSFKGKQVFEHRPNPAEVLRRAQEKTPPPHRHGYA